MARNSKLDKKLYDAVKKGDIKAVQKFLDLGADPNNVVGKGGRNAMHRAAEKGFAAIEALLFEYGGKRVAIDPADMKKQRRDSRADYLVLEPSGNKRPSQAEIADLLSDSSGLQPKVSRLSSLADGVRASVKRRGIDVAKAGLTASTDSDADKAGVYYNLATDPEDTIKPAKRTSASSSTVGDGNGSDDWEASLTRNEAEEIAQGHIKFDRKNLKQIKKLGEGNFGIVYEGEATGLLADSDVTPVAVKMLTETTPEALVDFNKEVQIMRSIAGCTRIVQLLGICVEKQPWLMLMELMSRGDLKTLLRGSRPRVSKPSPLSLKRMYMMGGDVAEGMEFLQRRRIVHRDLAARNCLVNEEWEVKIGDFGLTRDVYAGEYYKMTGSSPLPVRWMAPEAIGDGVYTSFSDIWSFGIVLWELCTFAKMPYPGLSNMEVVDKVAEESYRMPQPKESTDELYAIMADCWHDDPEQRPHFSSLKTRLVALAGAASDDPIAKAMRRQSQSTERPGDATVTSTITTASIVATTHAADSDDEDVKEVVDGVAYVSSPTSDPDDGPLYTEDVATKYPDLSSFQLAVKVAKDKSAIQKVTLEDSERPVVISSKSSSELVVDGGEDKDRDATLLQKAAKSDRSATVIPAKNADLGNPFANAKKVSQSPFSSRPSQSAPPTSPPADPAKDSGSHDVPDGNRVDGDGRADRGDDDDGDSLSESTSVSAMKNVWLAHSEQNRKEAERTNFEKYKKMSPKTSSSDATKMPAKELKKQEKERKKLEKQIREIEKREEKRFEKLQKQQAKEDKRRSTLSPKKVYGGAKSWVTSGTPSSVQNVGAYTTEGKKRVVNSGTNNSNASYSDRMRAQSVPQRPSSEGLSTSNKSSSDSLEAHTVVRPSDVLKAQRKVGDLNPRPTRGDENQQAPRSKSLSMPKKAIEANDAITSRAHESMDETIHKAAENIEKWVESVIGDYISGSSLFEILQSGEVLCQLMNKISPNSIAKCHKGTKLAFKKMENIGYFLEAAKAYGLPNTDLFITVDLFEESNMKQVVICLAALKKLAESKGVRF